MHVHVHLFFCSSAFHVAIVCQQWLEDRLPVARRARGEHHLMGNINTTCTYSVHVIITIVAYIVSVEYNACTIYNYCIIYMYMYNCIMSLAIIV